MERVANLVQADILETTMQARPLSIPAARVPSQPLQQNLSTHSSCAADPAPSGLAETTGLAHDAGNLVAALRLYTDLLSAPGVLGPRHEHYATELRLIADRASTLIQRLLVNFQTPLNGKAAEPERPDGRSLPTARADFSGARLKKPASAATSHALVLFQLAPILEHLAAGVAKVTVTCSESLPALDLSTEVLERITVNLFRNACEAIRRQSAASSTTASRRLGQIHIRLEADASHARLKLEDTGPGMREEMIAAYLRPTPLPYGARHGLGHRIVHQLVAESGGQLSIRVRPGYGTLICVCWPIPRSPAKTQPGKVESPAGKFISVSSTLTA